MKLLSLFRATIVACLISTLLSCKKSAADELPVNVGGYLESGTWHIGSFVEGGLDETTRFSGYSFSFSPNGSVSASGSGSATGYWGAGVHDGVSIVTLFFQSAPDLQELNDDWHVQNASATRIELSDTSGGNGGVNNLVLERD